ncbi:MAG: ATP-binding cassette domain-containing protein [Candidatus Afipia apatlaquensis]|uniref:ATP-binding cassette domain-containing protein n=1 Tax=Candidatus Afipia apatlaquensis TaxID=2712852 RepID=A0A7C9VCN0_9BRAD|nr:ATP-binding cassette domain-containing protein [Candidatus Afipia apatlaquensis]
MHVTELKIEGLFGKFNVKVTIKDNKLILIGPNGVGKSTIINTLYFLLSRQWGRLREINFTSASITIDGKSLTVDRDALEYWVSYSGRSSPTLSRYVERLRERSALEEFLKTKDFDAKARIKFSEILRVPGGNIKRLQADISTEFPRDLFQSPIRRVAEELEKVVEDRVLFLPTYRRIERELETIFPQVEEAYRRSIERESAFLSRRSKHYIELVSFGMQDVKGLVERRITSVREFARNQLNNLAGSYLTDVIRGKPENFSPVLVNDLDDDGVTDILNSVDEKSLSSEDKSVIKSEISSIRSHGRGRLTLRQKYLAHFFVKLREASELIKSNDEDIRLLSSICYKYLRPDKIVLYDDVNFSFQIVDRSISVAY